MGGDGSGRKEAKLWRQVSAEFGEANWHASPLLCFLLFVMLRTANNCAQYLSRAPRGGAPRGLSRANY